MGICTTVVILRTARIDRCSFECVERSSFTVAERKQCLFSELNFINARSLPSTVTSSHPDI